MPEIGIFLVPGGDDHEATVAQAVAADQAGLDYVAVQDHPYQRRFLDTWTLLAYLAAKTERVRLVPDVLNLPLRLPSLLAKSAASLDLLSDGRVELGIGAGAFWDAVEAFGGPRRTPKQSVDALEEAIAILRAFWSGEPSVTVEGDHYRVAGAKPGPQPSHPIGIWIGAYGPRMLRLTGRLGDGWLPSLGAPGHGRGRCDARRVSTRPPSAPGATPPRSSGSRIRPRSKATRRRGRTSCARAAELGFETLIVPVPEDDPVGFMRRLGEDVAPGIR